MNVTKQTRSGTGNKRYYPFSSTQFVSDPDTLESLGVRGKRVMELATLEVPILPGFLLSNASLQAVIEEPDGVQDFLSEALCHVESIVGKKFGAQANPLLIKVVESPMLNMLSTTSTIHNVGLCDETVDGFAEFVGHDFAYHEYRGILLKLIELEFQGGPAESRKGRLDAFREALASSKTREQIRRVIDENRTVYPEEVFTDAVAQLELVIELFCASFRNSTTASDSALLVQAMAFGNYDEKSCFGSYYTRNIVSGEPVISGKYFVNAFDATEKEGVPVTDIDGKVRKELEKIALTMERHFKEMRSIRFTVESGELWLIDQRPVPNKSTQAEIKTLLQLNRDRVIDDAFLIKAIRPGRLAEILHPVLEREAAEKVPNVRGGIAGAVGAAVGRVYFSTDRLMKAYKTAVQTGDSTDFILIMPATFAEDVKAIEVARGVISSEGGYASHAPVVARSLGKVALVLPDMECREDSVRIGKRVLKEGDWIALNVPYYDDPAIYFGKLEMTEPSPEGSGLLEVLEILQKYIGEDLDVHANGDQPKDAELAKKFGARGIGLCRTEHMFFDDKRIPIFRSMIIAGDLAERVKALNQLRKMQVDDFYRMLKTMAPYPVTIRLLDAPLHEFLPHTKESMAEFISYMQKKNPGITEDEIRTRCDMLREFNPMLGHRGVRVAVSYPEIYNMQVSAIFEAAYKLKQEGIAARPEIMIPIVMTANELKTIRNGKKIEGKSIVGIKEIEEEIRKKCDAREPVEYTVGSMIELPAAALQADTIARYADFFSFGTNDLTQTTNGLSRDDFNNFFSDYNEFDLLEKNPFQVLGEQVKELIRIAAERGRLTRPDIVMGICGEHGAEPANIPFVKEIGLNYISCSPYGIPIAKLAIAQMNIQEAERREKAQD